MNKVIQLIIGYWILALGVSLLIISNLGAGSWDAVLVGIHNKTNLLTIGTWGFIVKFLLIFINAILAKEKPDFKSVGSILLSSIAIDFWMILFFKDVQITNFFSQILLALGGLILLSFGIALYIRTKLLNGPIDGLMIATSKRFKISFQSARIINELLVTLIAFLIGGPVGVATIIISLALGYGIGRSMKLLDYAKDKWKFNII